jgi:transposase-like protein
MRRLLPTAKTTLHPAYDPTRKKVLAFQPAIRRPYLLKEHRAKIYRSNHIERLNGEIKRRTNVVGFFPNEASIMRLIGAILLEQNDEWAVQRARNMTLETMAPLSDNPIVMLSAVTGA